MDSPLDPIMRLVEKALTRPIPVHRWGTVTGVGPLRVRLDGDTDPLPFTPQNAAGTLTVGTRVWCVEQHRRVTILTGTNISRFITTDPATGRVYLGTGDTATNTGATYIGLSPATDTGTPDALWLNVNGDVVARVRKGGQIDTPWLPFASASGQITVPSAIGVDAFADITVTFPAGRFTATPRVSLGAGSARATVSHENTTTTTGMTVRVLNGSGSGNVPAGAVIDWTAVQMTATTGSG